jgi:mannitol operon transcriptional antiterminator
MTSLTLNQKKILQYLLNSAVPVSVADLAAELNLTPRQTSYRLKTVRSWLARRDVTLESTPGVGISVNCSPLQRQELINELSTQNDNPIILTAAQRQQLLALALLAAAEPLLVNWLGYISEVSRTTIFKDLEQIETWSDSFGLTLIRRPNYGIVYDGPEKAHQQALTSLLWGGDDIPFTPPLTAMAHGAGLVFTLDNYTTPQIVRHANTLLEGFDTQAAFSWVAIAEDRLGGRFTDNAVLQLALALAVQVQRVNAGHQLTCDPDQLAWLKAQRVWPVAAEVTRIIWPDRSPAVADPEIAGMAMQLLAGLRDHISPGELDLEPALAALVNRLMNEVAQAFDTPGLSHDMSLRDGLLAHVIPVLMRQRFGLWAPSSWSDGALSQEYQREYEIARILAGLVAEETGVKLPEGEIDTLTMLLRAAFVRERPVHPRRTYIICPSGMATAQLLVARLEARFPSLEILGVLSMRELTVERVADANLLITTVPIVSPRPSLQVIQVHQLLLRKDIEVITNWLEEASAGQF